MQILKTIGSLDDGMGALYNFDTIEHEGHFWLVPGWLEVPAAGYKIPARLIRLTDLAYQKFPPGSPYGDFALSRPLAKALIDLENAPPQDAGVVILDRPDVRFPIPRGIH